eukprot:356209-Chlamydomonas_euryale.AAC.7
MPPLLFQILQQPAEQKLHARPPGQVLAHECRWGKSRVDFRTQLNETSAAADTRRASLFQRAIRTDA